MMEIIPRVIIIPGAIPASAHKVVIHLNDTESPKKIFNRIAKLIENGATRGVRPDWEIKRNEE